MDSMNNTNDNEKQVTTTTATVEQQQQQVMELRAALDEQLELVRGLSEEEQLEWSVEEQLAQLVMLASRYPEHVLRQAVLTTYPASPQDTTTTTTTTITYSGRLPIHLACDTNAPIEIIRWLLDHDVDKESILKRDKWGDLPIHTACSRKDVNVVQLLLDSNVDKSTLLTMDNDGALPIHMACRYDAPAEVIRMLLEHDKDNKSLFVGAISNQLPLHVACRCNLPLASIQPLLDYDVQKKTVLIQDDAGRLPLHVAFLRNSHANVIQGLLEAMLVGRIARRGLELWKRDLQQMLVSLSVKERDFNASDKLEMTRHAILEFMERALVLELAVWSASCVRDCDNNNGMQPNDAEYKKQRHIKSGADIILPGVLSFLEHEPIDKIMAQLT